ncbi:sensor histidine kinase [Actinomadura kijaniata]|uniref:sensor histidine kinase n=1 Tax=Actinomadura kijaniata TaxID=46161 RepID=UPI003F1BCD13
MSDGQAGEHVGDLLRRWLGDTGRGLLVALLSQAAHIPLLVLTLVSLALVPVGVGVLLAPSALLAVRALADQQRVWAARWSGVGIPRPYRAAPPGATSPARRLWWLLRDPATWRDLLWLVAAIPVGLPLGLLPGFLAVYGLEGVLVAPWLPPSIGYGWGPFWPLRDWGAAGAAGCVVLGSALAVGGLRAGPGVLKGYALYSRWMLAPVRGALEHRVQELTETRSETVDASAAELRRIERDLHDGAQARLVALSMNIGLAEELMKRDPQGARRLLAEARETSGAALTELRGLVRGIHPPVLAERGLDGGVRALALALPLPVDVTVELPGRAAAPVESAAYFAVAEMLANVAKHSGARRAWIDLHHADGALTVIVGDDGRGGADPAAGSGIRGIERRLAAFDGTTVVTSPPGGPTVVTMRIPCALSGPENPPSPGAG